MTLRNITAMTAACIETTYGCVSRAPRARCGRLTCANGVVVMKTVLLGIIVTVLLGAPGVAHAQDRVRLEFVPGVLFATGDFADADLGTGFGAGVNLSVRVLPRLAPYVGWDWRHLQADTLFAGSDIDVEETGYAFGV